MNLVITLDRATRAQLEHNAIDAESFCTRAAAAYLRQCQDAAAILRVLDGPPEKHRPEERWAVEFASREPAVRQLAEKANQ